MSKSTFGRVTLWEITANGLWVRPCEIANTLMATFGWAACRLFGYGDVSYKINYMYIEYENVADPADPVTTPTYDNMDTRAYFDTLVAPQSYLRVPLNRAPDLQIAPGYSSIFTEGVDGNRLVFYGQTAGTSGMNGLAFSSAVNSKIFGVALVAAPVTADYTQDVIIARAYYDAASQPVKQTAGQVGITWGLTFQP